MLDIIFRFIIHNFFETNKDGIGLGREYFTKDHERFLEVANKNLPANNCENFNEMVDVQAYDVRENLYDLRTNQ